MLRWLFLALAACGGGADLVADAPPDLPVDADPNCHYDCFGSVSCAGKEVRYQTRGPVPRDQWTGECPYTTYTCTQGCDVAFESFPTIMWQGLTAFCAETSPISAGAPCSDPVECLPTRGVDS